MVKWKLKSWMSSSRSLRDNKLNLRCTSNELFTIITWQQMEPTMYLKWALHDHYVTTNWTYMYLKWALHDRYVTTNWTYDVPQMQEETLHSWITWTHNNNTPPQLQKESTTTLQMEVVHTSKTDYTVPYRRSQYEKLLKKKLLNLNFSRNQENWLENMTCNSWST
jgi:hypothetical protein